MKILYLYEHLDVGGAEQLLLTTLKYLDRKKFMPEVYCIAGEGEIGREIRELGVPVKALNKKLYLWNVLLLYDLFRIFVKERPDILHTSLFIPNTYGRVAARLAGIDKVVTTLHNPDYSYEDNGRWTFKVRKAIDKYSGKFCNSLFLAVSESVKDDFQKQLNFKNIEVLYNCIESERFVNSDKSKIIDKRRELGIAEDDVVLLNMGRLHPQKGQLCLIEAFNLISRENPKYKLIISGKGALETELKKRVKDFHLSDKVIFLQDRRDVPQIMAASDIFVFPSLYEGFGIVLVEAMASGLPVVASDIDGVREVVRNNIDGVLVEKENPEKLAEVIEALTKDKERRAYLAANARKRAVEMFDIRLYIRNLENIYQELVLK